MDKNTQRKPKRATPVPEPEKQRILAMRKRQYEIKRTSLLCSLILIALITLVISVVGILSMFMKKPTYSELERRELARFPTSIENFTSDFDLFFSDTFPFREQLMNASSNIKLMFGIRPGGKKLYGSGDNTAAAEEENIGLSTDKSAIDELIKQAIENDTPANDPPQNDGDTNIDVITPDATAPDVPPAEVPDNNTVASNESNDTGAAVTGEKRGVLYIVGDTALELFSGKEETAKYYSDVVNLHAETYKEYVDGINVYCLVFPTHIEFAMPKADKSMTRDQRPIIDAVKNNLSENVTFIDPYNSLKQKFNEKEYLYFRTDHHWTARGAYYAFVEFAKTLGLTPRSLDSYSTGRIEKFLGTFYASTNDPKLGASPDYVEYFDANVPYKAVVYKKDKTIYDADAPILYKGISNINNGYLCFTGGDQPYIKITTENKNGRKIIVFKESYGNAFVPYLLDDFEEIHVADIRTFPYNSAVFVQSNGITDVLFINSAMSATSADRIRNTEKLLTKAN